MTEAQINEVYAKGPALVMEDENCMAKYLHAEELKGLVQGACEKLDFVFMATCHSQVVAELFLEAGAQHVIGIKQSEAISDQAVLTFTESFYEHLFKEKSKIYSCFEAAKRQVEFTYKDQAENFVLITKDKKDRGNIYGNFQRGNPTFKEERPQLWCTTPEVKNILEPVVHSKKITLIKEFFKKANN